ncbi:hypothetical protein [Amycolatopsis sp. PS_44_ISF1]|uniref:hypothetical protein n=1 Tax=Amycolatopsis sp. PS_44_ISF1 TaxID=2974917 RepID=UPI0028DFBD8E|nr:hypothetical protein [Amycolatopsis sp. PS_44_ISF1]MDT8911379.1 hypothetical protein [Amycolatopsis sp. PS_44_ISF1]
MSWAKLYARSRQVPVALLLMAVCTVGMRVLVRDRWSVVFAELTLAAGIAVAAAGLSGQDLDLDRTAAFGWLPRRFGHLLLIGVLAAALLLVVQAPGPVQVETSVVLRDGAGLLGLAGLAATLFGGQFGWTFPLLWAIVALFVPGGGDSTAALVAGWPVQSAESPVAWWTAGILFGAGTAGYAVAGARR